MIGDFITSAGPRAEIFPDYSIANRGIGGDSTLDVLNCVDDVMLTIPLAVFVIVGINHV